MPRGKGASVNRFDERHLRDASCGPADDFLGAALNDAEAAARALMVVDVGLVPGAPADDEGFVPSAQTNLIAAVSRFVELNVVLDVVASDLQIAEQSGEPVQVHRPGTRI